MPALAIGVTLTSTPAEAMFAGTLPNDTDGPSDAARTCGSAVGVGLAVTSPPTVTVAVALATAVGDAVAVAVGVGVGGGAAGGGAVAVGVGGGVPEQSPASPSIVVDDEPVCPEESVATAVSVRVTHVTSHGIV